MQNPIKDSQDKLNQVLTLLEYMPILVYMKDRDRNYLTGSKYAKDFVFDGYDKYSNSIQIDMNACESMTTDEDNFVLEHKKMLIKDKRALDVDGKEHWYKILKAPILDEVNDISGLVTIAQNIDAEKQLESQKDLFIATLVHDLKNPLYAQISCLKMLKQGVFGNLNNEQKEILDTILESANSTSEMILNILNTYKYQNGIVKLQLEKVDIEELLWACINEAKGLASDRNVKVVVESKLKEEDKYINIDRRQIRRVIANLLNNGIRYAYTNTEFTIKISKTGDSLCFDFLNISPEIEEDIVRSMFEKYVSGVSQYKQIGFGLGMYLSKKIIDAHKGKIYLDAKGTKNRFVFELPIDIKNTESSQLEVVW